MNLKQTLGSFFVILIIVWMVVTGGVILGDITDDAFFDARAGFLQNFDIQDFLPVIALITFAFGSLCAIGGQYFLKHKLMQEKPGLTLLIIAIIYFGSAVVLVGVSNLFDAYLQSLRTVTDHHASSFVGFFTLYMAGIVLNPNSIKSLLKNTSPEEKSVSQ